MVQDAIEKADLLIEAMGWIRRFRDKITVIKLGGSVMVEPIDIPVGRFAFLSDPHGASFAVIALN